VATVCTSLTPQQRSGGHTTSRNTIVGFDHTVDYDPTMRPGTTIDSLKKPVRFGQAGFYPPLALRSLDGGSVSVPAPVMHEQRSERPDIGADRIELQELGGLFLIHAVALHQDLEALLVVVGHYRLAAGAVNEADHRIVEAFREQAVGIVLPQLVGDLCGSHGYLCGPAVAVGVGAGVAVGG